MDATSALTLPAPGGALAQTPRAAAGFLEVLLAAPRAPARGAALICHPHPLYGGAMSNKVVYTLASTALQSGLYALRFNFRGVGRSQGLHDEGRGETDDAVWLGEQLRAALPAGTPLLLAGFSFGSFVALKAAARLTPVALMSVAPPFGKYFGGEPAPAHPGCPWRVLHSRDDEVVDYAGTLADLERYRPAPELISVDGCGHFFHGRLDEVQRAFTGLIAQVLPG